MDCMFIEFSRPEYWSGYSFLSPVDLPNPGIKPGSPALQVDSLPTDLPGKPSTMSECESHSVVSDSLQPHGVQRSLSITKSQSLLKLMTIESVMPSNHLILCHPLLLQSFPALGSFQMTALCIRWPNYWSFSFSISPSNEYSGLISFRTDWFDLAVQGVLKNLLQNHSSKASILRCSAFVMVQLSHPYMTTGKI